MHRFVPILAATCALFSCATPVEVSRCERSLLDSPPPLEPCLRDPVGREYVMGMAQQLADDLIGWRGAPGAAEVTLAFALDGSVDAVCLGPTEGDVVSARAPEAVAALEALPRGPACLSGRSLVLAWESPVVTDQEKRR